MAGGGAGTNIDESETDSTSDVHRRVNNGNGKTVVGHAAGDFDGEGQRLAETENGTTYKNGEQQTSLEQKQQQEEDDQETTTTVFGSFVEKIEKAVRGFMSRNKRVIKRGLYISLLAVYMAYFIYCMQYRFGDEGSIILLVITIFLAWRLLSKYLDSKDIHLRVPRSVLAFLESGKGRRLRKIGRVCAYIAATSSIMTFLGVSVFSQHPQNLQSFVGMLLLILLCFVFSVKPSKINWYPVFWSFVIQFLVATLTLRTQVGHDVFQWLGDLVQNLLAFADDGSEFVVGEKFRDWGLAFTATGTIIFTNAFIFLMNHIGAIEFVVLRLGNFLAFALETGPVESVVAAANIFLGLTEAPLLIRPYLPTMTDSELHSVMTCGFASISGGTLAIFIGIGAPANHLLTAAVISAPAALAFSKLMYPETERVVVENQGNIRMVDDKKDSNALNAYSEGAVMGLRIATPVFANLLAFVSVLALVDALCVWAGERAGIDSLTFSTICSYILFPVAYMMGVAVDDCRMVAKLLGVRWVSTPVVAYSQLGDLIENRKTFEAYTSLVNNSWHRDGDDVILENYNVTLVDGFLQQRTEVISTYAMCGFSALTAIGITMGTLPSLCPARKQDVLRLVTTAFVAGNVASFATGAVAGVLFSPDITVS